MTLVMVGGGGGGGGSAAVGTLSGSAHVLFSPCSTFGHCDRWIACSLQAKPKAGASSSCPPSVT